MAQRDSGVGKGVLEGEAAPEEERHQVLAPVREDVGRFLGEGAVPPDPVAGQVGAQVGARRQRGAPHAGSGDVEYRAGLGVAAAEVGQVGRPVGGHGDQVGLDVAGCPAGRGPGGAGAEVCAGGGGAHAGWRVG